MTGLPIWVVYERPRDYPDSYVARLWHGEQPTDSVVIAPSLELLREQMMDMGLTPVPRFDDDHVHIVEVWL